MNGATELGGSRGEAETALHAAGVGAMHGGGYREGEGVDVGQVGEGGNVAGDRVVAVVVVVVVVGGDIDGLTTAAGAFVVVIEASLGALATDDSVVINGVLRCGVGGGQGVGLGWGWGGAWGRWGWGERQDRWRREAMRRGTSTVRKGKAVKIA